MLPLNPSVSQFMTLTQELVLGLDLAVPMPNRHYRALPVRAGRFLREGDRRVAVLGASFAAARGLRPGSRLALEGASYEGVGVLERMLTAPDRFVFVPIQDAREQWVAKDRLLQTVLASGAAALTAADLNTGAAVGWKDGEEPDAVALRIRERVPGVNVQLPSELSGLLRSSTALFSALPVGIGARRAPGPGGARGGSGPGRSPSRSPAGSAGSRSRWPSAPCSTAGRRARARSCSTSRRGCSRARSSSPCCWAPPRPATRPGGSSRSRPPRRSDGAPECCARPVSRRRTAPRRARRSASSTAWTSR